MQFSFIHPSIDSLIQSSDDISKLVRTCHCPSKVHPVLSVFALRVLWRNTGYTGACTRFA